MKKSSTKDAFADWVFALAKDKANGCLEMRKNLKITNEFYMFDVCEAHYIMDCYFIRVKIRNINGNFKWIIFFCDDIYVYPKNNNDSPYLLFDILDKIISIDK